MDNQALEALLTALEADRVERKESITDKEKICEAICAFANDLPNHQQAGVLFIGMIGCYSHFLTYILTEILRHFQQ